MLYLKPLNTPFSGFHPTPKDNYLFDLAIQKNCSFIVSDDGLLQRMKLKPVPVKSTNWFLKHYPI
jgi:predicted nucleic acid-binding protein